MYAGYSNGCQVSGSRGAPKHHCLANCVFLIQYSLFFRRLSLVLYNVHFSKTFTVDMLTFTFNFRFRISPKKIVGFFRFIVHLFTAIIFIHFLVYFLLSVLLFRDLGMF